MRTLSKKLLPQTAVSWQNIRDSGDETAVLTALNAAAEGRSIVIELAKSPIAAKRLMRNFYQVLRDYPNLKPLISLRLTNTGITILVGQRFETRGRKGRK